MGTLLDDLGENDGTITKSDLLTVLDKKINKKIDTLSPEQEAQFRENLKNCLYSRTWCAIHGVDYNKLTKYDILLAKIELYEEMFRSKTHPKLPSP